MINELLETMPDLLKSAVEKLEKSTYANSSPEKRATLRRLIKQIESQTTELSRLYKNGGEGLTEEQKRIIIECLISGGE